MAPGNTSQTPTVPTLSIEPVAARCRFDGERNFGSGEERIATLGHEHRAGVTAFTFNVHPQAGGRGNRGYDADVEAARFQDRSLFDVQFDERGIASLGECDRRQCSRESRARADVRQRAVLTVLHVVSRLGIERGRHQAAAEATHAKTRRLLRCEQDQLERPAGTKTRSPKRTKRLDGPEHANRSIESAGIWNGVDVRSGGDSGQRRIGSGPAGRRCCRRRLPGSRAAPRGTVL